MIQIFLANSNTIILEGLAQMLKSTPEFSLLAKVSSADMMYAHPSISKADVLVIDYSSEFFDLLDLKKVTSSYPNLRVVGITDYTKAEMYKAAISFGIQSHILNCCDAQELQEAIQSAYENEKFFCEKVIESIERKGFEKGYSCNGIKLSKREIEIIALISEGLTNKQIAHQLHVSSHTIMTHRKNIMQKLGISNTANLVMFAVKQKIVQPNKFLFATQ